MDTNAKVGCRRSVRSAYLKLAAQSDMERLYALFVASTAGSMAEDDVDGRNGDDVIEARTSRKKVEAIDEKPNASKKFDT
jgi:hypothetical protein